MEFSCKCKRVHLAVMFATLFLVVGWVAPAAYAAYAPQEQFMEVHDLSAENATVGDVSHTLTIDRTIGQTTTGTVYTELYLIEEETDNRIRISSEMMERPLREGRVTIEDEQELPPEVMPGSYNYELTVRMELAEGRIFRTFTYESNTFYISE